MLGIALGISVSVAGILIFMAHAYYRHGRKLTFEFFFFGLFIASFKEGPVMIDGVLRKNPHMPYEFLVPGVAPLITNVLAIIGWVFTFYAGWYIGERISRRLGALGERLFVVTVLGGLAAASIGYAVEAAAIASGTWHWTIHDGRLEGILAGIPLIALVTWMHFPTQYLLLPFLLIECSPFKHKSWKGIFFAIPFAHSLTTCPELDGTRIIVEYAAFFALVLCAFACPLRLDFPPSKIRRGSNFMGRKLLDRLPLIIIGVLLLTLLWLDAAHLRGPALFASALPLAVMLLLAVERIPLWAVIAFTVLGFFVFKGYAATAGVLMAFFLALRLAQKVFYKRTGVETV